MTNPLMHFHASNGHTKSFWKSKSLFGKTQPKLTQSHSFSEPSQPRTCESAQSLVENVTVEDQTYVNPFLATPKYESKISPAQSPSAQMSVNPFKTSVEGPPTILGPLDDPSARPLIPSSISSKGPSLQDSLLALDPYRRHSTSTVLTKSKGDAYGEFFQCAVCRIFACSSCRDEVMWQGVCHDGRKHMFKILDHLGDDNVKCGRCYAKMTASDDVTNSEKLKSVTFVFVTRRMCVTHYHTPFCKVRCLFDSLYPLDLAMPKTCDTLDQPIMSLLNPSLYTTPKPSIFQNLSSDERAFPDYAKGRVSAEALNFNFVRILGRKYDTKCFFRVMKILRDIPSKASQSSSSCSKSSLESTPPSPTSRLAHDSTLDPDPPHIPSNFQELDRHSGPVTYSRSKSPNHFRTKDEKGKSSKNPSIFRNPRPISGFADVMRSSILSKDTNPDMEKSDVMDNTLPNGKKSESPSPKPFLLSFFPLIT